VLESFTETFAAGLASYVDRPCIEFEGRWYSGNDITAYADAIASALRDGGVADGAPVGLVVRNRLQHAAAIIGFLAAGRPVSMIYSFQSPESIPGTSKSWSCRPSSPIARTGRNRSSRPPSGQAVQAWRSR
jgi:long-chain acyl-CoA synthetase